MKKVRFKKQYAGDFKGDRISYELVDDELVMQVFQHSVFDDFHLEPHYNTKLLGLVPAYMLEEADGNEVPVIDVIVKLSN